MFEKYPSKSRKVREIWPVSFMKLLKWNEINTFTIIINFWYYFDRLRSGWLCDVTTYKLEMQKWPNDWDMLWILISTVHLAVSYYHVTYVVQSESTLYSCLNIKELLTRKRRDSWSLNDSNEIRTHNHLLRKRTLNH